MFVNIKSLQIILVLFEILKFAFIYKIWLYYTDKFDLLSIIFQNMIICIILKIRWINVSHADPIMITWVLIRKKLSGHIPHLLSQKLGVKPASSVLAHFPNDFNTH